MLGSILEIPGCSHVVGVVIQQVVESPVSDVINAEHSSRPKLVLDSAIELNGIGRPKVRPEQVGADSLAVAEGRPTYSPLEAGPAASVAAWKVCCSARICL